MALAQLFSRTTQALMFNFKPDPVQRMLDFDHLCKRETPSIAGLITPGSDRGNHKVFFGAKEILVPIYGTVQDAVSEHPKADVFINYASYRSAFASSLMALNADSIKVVIILAEGVPENEARKLIALAKRKNKVVIGPATIGGIQAGAFKVGDAAGTIENILECKLYRSGSVGFVSKSGGLSNESYNIISKTTNGLFEGIAIGGDVYAASTFADHILRFEQIPEIKMIVMLGEIGGYNEYGVVELLKQKKVTKPVVAWVSGSCAKLFPTEVQFGHAGAKSGSEKESSQAKNQALREAGALVPDSFEGYAEVIEKTYKELVASGVIVPQREQEPPSLPINFNSAIAEGRIRRATGIVSTICDDRGEEPTYCRKTISDILKDQSSLGEVIGLLWFKRELPRYATRFIEIVLVLCADHGPCVSGAHNTIVAARAGKDIVSCLTSGLLTIGPRFGGAIDDAARHFKRAVDSKLKPAEFVEDMKKRGILIPGIGHRIKSANNLDKRVLLMKQYAEENFRTTRYLQYALEVEKVTLQKAANLLLNVDGCVAVLFLDLMENCASFSKEEMQEVVDIGYLNGLFVLARSIGLIGHALDQKRLKQPLYRHPWDDVMYCQ